MNMNNEQRLREEQQAAIEFFKKREAANMNRHHDALAIQQGACNPVAITKRLHDHVQAMFHDGADWQSIRNDSALRLIAHQLAYLFNTSSLDGAGGEYDRCIKECQQGASK